MRVILGVPHDQGRPGLQKYRWWLIAAAIALIACVGTWHLLTRGGELSVSSTGRAVSLLAAIEAEANLPVRQRGPVEREGPDGPMPEIAGRKLIVASDAATIAARVAGACRTLGLAPAEAKRRAIEPDALCDGGKDHSGDSVHLSLSCNGMCTAYLQTQILG